tara:strand:+ start:388 stop:942 length:555 start_codon:yes stop_codon:yes gene_type:complete
MGMLDLAVLAAKAVDGVSANELHGAVCGLLPGAEEDYVVFELQSLFNSDNVMDAQALMEFVEASRDDLFAEDLSFSPLLPADEEPIDERVKAIVEWTSAFLAGFGITLARVGQQIVGEESQEILDDLAAVTELDIADIGAESEEMDAESDLFHIEEFVKVGVLLLSGTIDPKEDRPGGDFSGGL